MAQAKMTSKGQITLPKALRDKMGVKPGDRITIAEAPGARWLVISASEPVTKLRGLLPKSGRRTVEEIDATIKAAAVRRARRK